MKTIKKGFIIAISLIAAFILWTVLVGVVDVQAIGPNGSKVGFATVNRFFYTLTGTSFGLYILTDWLGLVPIAFMLIFAVVGLIQWIKRKAIYKVDIDILVLGGYYIVVFLVYMLFEYLIINYRPVLIEGYLEASYPSSTTMLVCCVMPTTIFQLKKWTKKATAKRLVEVIITCYIMFMVCGRFVSGVHWFSDIVGGLLFSAGIVAAYFCACTYFKKRRNCKTNAKKG